MARKRHLGAWCEDANLGRMGRILWRKNERRFGKIEFGGNRLHLLRRQPASIGQDGEGIAAEAPIGEDIDGHEIELHVAVTSLALAQIRCLRDYGHHAGRANDSFE
jgi:hypothetical protein